MKQKVLKEMKWAYLNSQLFVTIHDLSFLFIYLFTFGHSIMFRHISLSYTSPWLLSLHVVYEHTLTVTSCAEVDWFFLLSSLRSHIPLTFSRSSLANTHIKSAAASPGLQWYCPEWCCKKNLDKTWTWMIVRRRAVTQTWTTPIWDCLKKMSVEFLSHPERFC